MEHCLPACCFVELLDDEAIGTHPNLHCGGDLLHLQDEVGQHARIRIQQPA